MADSLLQDSSIGNTESQRAQSFGSRPSSVTSVPLCFKILPAAKQVRGINANWRGLGYGG
jgi:hypothetical protein